MSLTVINGDVLIRSGDLKKIEKLISGVGVYLVPESTIHFLLVLGNCYKSEYIKKLNKKPMLNTEIAIFSFDEILFRILKHLLTFVFHSAVEKRLQRS